MKLSSEVRIGIIITIAIAMTIWGLNFLKGRNILQRVDTYYAIFQNIGGLEKNSKIYINGYRVGQVGNIVFSPDGSNRLKVALGIDKEYRLPYASTAVLYDADFMGTKAIQIRLGESDRYLESGDTLETSIQAGLAGQLQEQIFPVKEKAENLIVTIDSFTTALAYVFDRESADLLKSSIRKMESSMDGVEDLLAEEGKLNLLIENLESITRNLKQHNEQLSAAMVNLESITDSIARSELKQTIDNASRTLEQTREIMEKINRGEGTLGLLVNNDSLYLNLTSLAGELDLLLKDLQENPRKYVNVSVFGKSDKKIKIDSEGSKK